jgi:cell division protein FtsB
VSWKAPLGAKGRMETVNEVKQALSAKSRTATLDELRNEGRKRVRLIKAEHVAAMITEAVHAAIGNSGLISKEEADTLVAKSKQEFQTIVREREAQLQRAADLESRLRERDSEIAQLQQELATARTVQSQVAVAPMAAVVTAPAPAAVTGTPDLTAALEKLAGSLNDRLEKLGKKMGISAAVEAGEVKFDGLFKDSDKALESNMKNVELKQKSGGGIAANLAKLKKLKGGS